MEHRIAFDSNVLTIYLDVNTGGYRPTPDDALADERVAAFRLFLYCTAVIVPSVTAEFVGIGLAARQQAHLQAIAAHFVEFVPDDSQEFAIEARVAELLHHHANEHDCRVLAEVETDVEVKTLVTVDRDFRRKLGPHTEVRLLSPVECWALLDIPRGTPPAWTPGPGHPVAAETWWRWE